MAGKKLPKPKLYVAPERVGRPRKVSCVEEMWTLWEEYKQECDGHMRQQTVISKTLTGTQAEQILVAAPLTYTKKGFCLYIGIRESAFDETYGEDEDYAEFMELLEMATEIDARSKFEDGTLNPKLAALWMGRHKGYSAKQETEITGSVPVVIRDDLGD